MPRVSRKRAKRECKGIKAPMPRNKRRSKRHYRGLKGDKLLGSGGYGTTVMRKSKTGESIAVKLVSRKYESKEAKIQQLAYEASPHVARVFNHCHLGSGAGLVTMEVLSGGKVDFHSSLSAPVIRRATWQLMNAMAQLHYKGIFHRDLKEENVLFDRDPKYFPDTFNVKIIDFGLTCLRDEKCPHEGSGTREMFPPEHYVASKHRRAFDEALYNAGRHRFARFALHDVWSVGIMLAIKCQGEYCTSTTDVQVPSVHDSDFQTTFEKRCERTMRELKGRSCANQAPCIIQAYTIEIEKLRNSFEAAVAAQTVPSMRWAHPLVRALLEPNVFKRPHFHHIIEKARAENVFGS